jgi:transketolase
MPCVEWFSEQDASYREEVLPNRIRAWVCVEAGITLGWRAYAGDSVGVEHFGASADCQRLYEEFGLTGERVAAVARTVPHRLGALRG